MTLPATLSHNNTILLYPVIGLLLFALPFSSYLASMSTMVGFLFLLLYFSGFMTLENKRYIDHAVMILAVCIILVAMPSFVVGTGAVTWALAFLFGVMTFFIFQSTSKTKWSIASIWYLLLIVPLLYFILSREYAFNRVSIFISEMFYNVAHFGMLVSLSSVIVALVAGYFVWHYSRNITNRHLMLFLQSAALLFVLPQLFLFIFPFGQTFGFGFLFTGDGWVSLSALLALVFVSRQAALARASSS